MVRLPGQDVCETPGAGTDTRSKDITVVSGQDALQLLSGAFTTDGLS